MVCKKIPLPFNKTTFIFETTSSQFLNNLGFQEIYKKPQSDYKSILKRSKPNLATTESEKHLVENLNERRGAEELDEAPEVEEKKVPKI